MQQYFIGKTLDKNTPIPLYFQLKELLLAYIKEEHEATPLPTEQWLCEYFDISRTTARQALGELTQEGFLIRQKGKGTMIAPKKIPSDFLSVVESFNDEMHSKHLPHSTNVISLQREKPDEKIQNALRLESHEKVLRLVRLRNVDGEPVVLVDTYLPFDRYNLGTLAHDDLENSSLYDLMRTQCHVEVDSSHRVLEIRKANANDAKYLGITENESIWYIRTTSYNENKIPVEYSLARYRADKNVFILDVKKTKSDL
jgi:GntR family transcriptional regulator